jgi:hypothetical protein
MFLVEFGGHIFSGEIFLLLCLSFNVSAFSLLVLNSVLMGIVN